MVSIPPYELEPLDQLNIAGKSQIKSGISTEICFYTGLIKKRNRFGMIQTRSILITNTAIYNLKGGSLQRRIEISKLKGITISQNSDEFVIHGNEDEYDYFYISHDKNRIIFFTERFYEKVKGGELLFSISSNSSLYYVVTTKKEKKKNPKFSRMDETNLSDINAYIDSFSKEPKEIVVNRKTDTRSNSSTSLNSMPNSGGGYRGSIFKQSGDDVEESGNDFEYSQEEDIITETKLIKNRQKNIWDFNDEDDDGLYGANLMIKEDEYDFINEDLISLSKASLDDFTFLKIIGKGMISTVYMARYNYNNKIYAIKGIDKHHLISNNCIDNGRTEKAIGTSKQINKNKYISKLNFYFQTQCTVFLVYDFYQGGDGYSLLSMATPRNCGEEDKAVLFISQIVCAITTGHNNNMIYRNGKPENVCIDKNGYIKGVDFMKGKILFNANDRGTGFYGTPEYVPPEIIRGECQTKAVDWWALGVLMYEMGFGKCPFESDFIDRTYDLILYCEGRFPKTDEINVSEEAKDLIGKGLIKDPSKRLGSLLDGNEIKKHKWFSLTNSECTFDKIEEQDFVPVFVPEIKGEDDVSYFDQGFGNEEIDLFHNIDGYNLDLIRNGNKQNGFADFDLNNNTGNNRN